MDKFNVIPLPGGLAMFLFGMRLKLSRLFPLPPPLGDKQREVGGGERAVDEG